MNTVKITRKQDGILLMVPAQIIINDAPKGKIKNGQTAEVSLAAGSYELQIKTVYGMKTAKVPISVVEGQTHEIEITRDSRYMKIYMTCTLPIVLVGLIITNITLYSATEIGVISLLATMIGAMAFSLKANKVMFEVKQVK
jgi:hypothetical protein